MTLWTKSDVWVHFDVEYVPNGIYALAIWTNYDSSKVGINHLICRFHRADISNHNEPSVCNKKCLNGFAQVLLILHSAIVCSLFLLVSSYISPPYEGECYSASECAGRGGTSTSSCARQTTLKTKTCLSLREGQQSLRTKTFKSH